MQADTALLAGVLFGVSLWLLLQRSFVRILFGLILFTNAANLFVLMMSGEPSLLATPIARPGAVTVDPLPQALILTAIVIGFGITAYLVTLLYRLFLESGTTNADELYADEPAEREKSK
jgi:multicomponent Na+:H+ antiporter subunit C